MTSRSSSSSSSSKENDTMLRPKIIEASFRPYQYEVSLDCTAKGWIQPSVKVRSDTLNQGEVGIQHIATDILDWLVHEVRDKGYKVATDFEEITKNGKE